MRRRLHFFPLIFALIPFQAFAASKIRDIIESITEIVGLITTIVLALVLVAFGWGVVRFILAAQNPEERKKAKEFLFWSIIAVFVVASIAGLIAFLQAFFGIENITTFPIPRF